MKKSILDDTVDLEFRKLAMREEDLNDTALDLFDIMASKRSIIDKTARKTFKIMDDAGGPNKSEQSSFDVDPVSARMPTDRGHK